MKKPVVKQVEEITAEFKAKVSILQQQADLRFSASTLELTQTCQQFRQVYSHPVSPERCCGTGAQSATSPTTGKGISFISN